MKLTGTNHIEISRRNAETLIEALNRGMDATVSRFDGDHYMRITLVEDSDHYGDRTPGPMPFDNESE